MTAIVKVSDKQIKDAYDGFDLYFDHQDKILYSSPKCLARWLDCQPNTVKNEAGKIGVGKDAEIHTQQGIRMGKLYTSPEVIEILSAIASNTRIKKETRDNAHARLKLLATLGNELGGMLAIAPDELAKVAINRITDNKQADSVSEHLSQHQKYLKEYHGLHDVLKSRGAEGIHHATVNKHNNQLAGVRQGNRDFMTERQKDVMTFVQLAEKIKVGDTQTNNAWQAVNVCKRAGSQAKAALNNILGS